jgi:hypothetical protein
MISRKPLSILVVLAIIAAFFGTALPARAATQIAFSYTLPAGNHFVNDTFTLPVNVTVPADKPLAGIQFDLSWDPAVLDLLSVDLGPFFDSANGGCTLVSNPFSFTPSINHSAGTMSNFSIAGMGIPDGEGCFNSGASANTFVSLVATLHLKAVGAGSAILHPTNIVISANGGAQYADTDYVFPDQSLSVLKSSSLVAFSYTAPTGAILPNATFDVPVNVAVPADKPLAGVQFDLTWDPAVVDLVSVTQGAFFSTCSLVTSPFGNSPTLNHSAGMMTNYSIAGLGIPADQGCFNTGTSANTTSSVVATLHFKAIAVNQTALHPANIIVSANGGAPYLDAEYTFPDQALSVVAAPKLSIQSIEFEKKGGGSFAVKISVKNPSQDITSLPTVMAVTTDGKATPASQNVNVPAIAAGGVQGFTLDGSNGTSLYHLTSGSSKAVISAAIADSDTSMDGEYIGGYLVYLPLTIAK